jgi:hypothetical protein
LEVVEKKSDMNQLISDLNIKRGTYQQMFQPWSVPMMVPKWNQDEFDIVFENDWLNLTLFVDDGDSYRLMDKFAKSAKACENKVLFSFSGIFEGAQAKAAKILGVNTKTTMEPLLIAHRKINGIRERFAYPGKINELTEEKVIQFL